MKNLEKDKRIAVSVYSTNQSTFGDVAAIQLEGSTSILQDRKEIEHAYKVYYGRKYPDKGRDPKKGVGAYLKNPEWIFVKVAPEHVYYFNTRFFDEERKEVPTSVFKQK